LGFLKKFNAELTDPAITRGQLLFTSAVCFFVSYLQNFHLVPFDDGFYVTAFVSGVFHFILFLFFGRIVPAARLTLSVMSLANMVMLGFAVHYTGGVVSPFVFIFFSIIISEAAYGIEYPVAPIAALLVYGVVIGGEYWGVFQRIPISAQSIYATPTSALAIVVVTGTFMFITNHIHKMILNNLRARLEKQHAEREIMLRQLSQLEAPSQVGLLVNKIVHDINGPLGAVSGFISLFQKEKNLSPRAQEDCSLMLEEINRVSTLAQRLLKYTRPSRSEKQPVSLVDLLETVLAVLTFHPLARGVTFIKTFPDSESLLVQAKKDELQQVYFNLLKNSLEAMQNAPGPRVIRLEMKVVGKNLELAIRDNGPGIPLEISEKLSREMMSTKKEGSGVGLVIVREILEAHGGGLEIKAGGEGAWIVTRLPLCMSLIGVQA